MFVTNKKTFLLLFLIGFTLNCKTISKIMSGSGTEFIVQVETDESDKDKIFQQSINELKNAMNLADLTGRVSVISDKSYQLNVKIYEPKDIERAKRFLFTTYQLELKKVVTPPSPSPVQQYLTEDEARAKLLKNQEILPYTDAKTGVKGFVIVEAEPIITGDAVRQATAQSSGGITSGYDKNGFQVTFSLKKDGAEKFGAWTGKNINSYLAVVLNKQVASIAFIKSQMFDSGQIDGRFTKEEAEDIAHNLNRGSLPVKFNVLSETEFGK